MTQRVLASRIMAAMGYVQTQRDLVAALEASSAEAWRAHALAFEQRPFQSAPGVGRGGPERSVGSGDPSDEDDDAIEANARFEYPLVAPAVAAEPHPRLVVLLHGLNERSWHKHLAWAKALVAGTGAPVALFPMAFHMSRAPDAWSDPRAMLALSRDRRRRIPDLAASSFANAALSARLHARPARFMWSGLRTARDLAALARELRAGALPGFTPGARLDLFAYSAGAFLAEIVLMADPGGLFAESRLFAFCGGSVLALTNPVSKHILDSAAGEAVNGFFGEGLEAARTRDPALRRTLDDEPVGRAFSWMLRPDREADARRRALGLLAPRMRAVACRRDGVIPAEAVRQTLAGSGVPLEIVDFDHPYDHVSPFPFDGRGEASVDRAFESVFTRATRFLA